MRTSASLNRSRPSDETAPRRRAVCERVVAAELLALLVSGGCLAGCGTPAVTSRAQRELTIAVGFEDSVADHLGRALARSSETDIPGLSVRTRFARGVDGNLEALRSGIADLGFVDAEGAYVGYRQEQSGRSTGQSLRAVAVLYPTAIHIFAKRELGIRSVEQLRGRAVVVGEREGYADRSMRMILESYNLSYATVQPIFVSGQDAADAVRDGTAAAIVFYTPYRSRPILEAMEAAELALVPLNHLNIAQIQSTSERNHFVKTTTIPGGTYPGQSHDVLTMGDETLLLCRSDLDDELVYALTKSLFDSVPSLVLAHPAAASINIERGPTTSVPLHPGAARYYRERELPR